MFSPYDFGYSWILVNGHLIPLAISAAVVAVALWRGWPRWITALAGIVALWSVAGFLAAHLLFRLNAPVEPPTSRFLASGSGRVLDAGAGSGRAGVGVLLARPKTTVVGLDIYSGYWGIDDNTPERFLRNARIAGAASRHQARGHEEREQQPQAADPQPRDDRRPHQARGRGGARGEPGHASSRSRRIRRRSSGGAP